MPVIERKYALTKNTAGDYCLPSNDGRIIWRIASYLDATEPEDWPRQRTMWWLSRWSEEVGPGSYVDLSWEDPRWTTVERNFATRREAIAFALNAS